MGHLREEGKNLAGQMNPWLRKHSKAVALTDGLAPAARLPRPDRVNAVLKS